MLYCKRPLLVGTKSQLFPEILWRRLSLSRSINFNYYPSSIHFSISFADLDILYSARSLRDLSTIQILAATPQQTRLISRRLSWEDPDLFINIHNMHIGTHTFYKYIQYWHWKYKYIWHSGWLWLGPRWNYRSNSVLCRLSGLFQNLAFGPSTLFPQSGSGPCEFELGEHFFTCINSNTEW